MNLFIKYYKVDKKNIPNRRFFLKLIKSVLNNKKYVYFISIKIVNKNEIKYLNIKYKNKNEYTDVLTFSKEIILNKKIYLFVDIVICKYILEEKSKLYKRNLFFHWSHIIIHSCLHAIKYDHINIYQSEIMEKKEIEILKKFNIPNPYIIY